MKFIYNDPKLKGRRQRLRKDQTEAEKIVWNCLRKKQFYEIKYYRQYGIGSYILDFYSPKYKLAIELDGAQHAEDQNKEYDAHRSEYLMSHGIQVVRFWNNEVMKNMEGVLYKIAEAIGINLSQE